MCEMYASETILKYIVELANLCEISSNEGALWCS